MHRRRNTSSFCGMMTVPVPVPVTATATVTGCEFGSLGGVLDHWRMTMMTMMMTMMTGRISVETLHW